MHQRFDVEAMDDTRQEPTIVTGLENPARDVVVIPDVDALPWRKLPSAGLYARSLSVDAATGARTAILRMVPEEGYVPPATAHYHDTYEEIVGLAGRFTFDKEVWLGRAGYIFHPAGTVHGFASVVPEDSTFLSRVGAGHVGNSVPEPALGAMYSVYETPDPRAPASTADPVAGTEPTLRPFLGSWEVEWHEVSAAPSGAHGAAMVVLPGNWRPTESITDVTVEIFTLDAGLVFGGAEPIESAASYVRIPAGAVIPDMECRKDVRAFIAFGEI
jgi:quercetin dioxygenase-like cupin family protein